MNADYVTGIGLIARSISELLLDKNPALALTDFLKGLGSFGVHKSITVAMQAPVGQAALVFEDKDPK